MTDSKPTILFSEAVMNNPEDDQQIQALMRASGHTVDDAILILNELNKNGWTVRTIDGFLTTNPRQRVRDAGDE